jgi:hypothetical protein
MTKDEWDAQWTCSRGTRGCPAKNEDHACDIATAQRRAAGIDRAFEDQRQYAEVQAKLDAKALAKEERLAWDRYVAVAVAAQDANILYADAACAWADKLLEERRKRFGADK